MKFSVHYVDVSHSSEASSCAANQEFPNKGLTYLLNGCGIAQAVSRRLPIAVARVRSQVRSYGICSGKSVIGADFL
jgi:hypothetical protein